MKQLTQTTTSIKLDEIKRQWHLIDVSGNVLGRMAGEISRLLQGKHKTNYAPYLDAGDYVIVINMKKVVVTGNKAKAKTYGQYSGYPSGLKTRNYEKLLAENPEAVMRHAVSGMLPKNKTRDVRLARLFVYPDANHPYGHKLAH